MNEQLVSFETAKLAKEKGFNIEVKCYYDLKKFGERPLEFFGKLNANDLTKWNEELRENVHAEYVSAPTQSLLQKWLREKHNIHISIFRYENNAYTLYLYKNDCKRAFPFNLIESSVKSNNINQVIKYNSYEEALEEGLLEALKLI